MRGKQNIAPIQLLGAHRSGQRIPEEIKAIIAYRIDKSDQALKEAKDNAALGNWSLVVNRLYYAVFDMALALLFVSLRQ